MTKNNSNAKRVEMTLTCSDRERHQHWAIHREIFYHYYGQSTCPYACKKIWDIARLGSLGWPVEGVKVEK